MTFLLVMTVYASAVAKPGHGNTAPLAIGLSLYAAAISGVFVRSGACTSHFVAGDPGVKKVEVWSSEHLSLI